MYYLVYIRQNLDNITDIVVCSDKELTELLLHLDREKYTIIEATKFADKLWNIKEFCKTDPKLEVGSS